MTIGAAADIQIGPLVLEAMASLHADMRSLTESVAKAAERIARVEELYAKLGPVDVPLRAAATSNSSGSGFLLDLGGPASGRVWLLRRLLVGTTTWTSVAGTANVYVSAVRPSPGQGNLADMVDNAATLPLAAFYSNRQIALHAPQRLYVELVNPVASTTYVAGGSAEDLPDVALLARTEA